MKTNLSKSQSKPSRVQVRYRNHEGDITKYLVTDEIIFIEADGSSTKFHLKDGSLIISGKHLGYYEESITKLIGFIKVGRSYIVNAFEIDSFNNSDGYLVLKPGSQILNHKPHKIRVSRDAKPNILKAISLL
jgi:DNA-binding LytR/AlgR family response regulator